MGDLPPSGPRAETSSETEDVANRCIACREEIQPRAKVCTHCNQFQDWRRFFGLSSTVLSLLVALVSVLSIAIPAILNVTTPQQSDIRCSLLEWEEETGFVKLAVSNKGSRAAVVQGLLLESNPMQKENPTTFHPDSQNWEPVLEPQKYRMLTFVGKIGNSQSLRPLGIVRQDHSLRLVIFPFQSSNAAEIACDNWSTFDRSTAQ